MCGIFGAINLSGYFNSSDYQMFVKQTNLVSYRGPDDNGYIAFNTKSLKRKESEFDVFFGHRRLSIIDLSVAGHQPFTDREGLWIIFNGEIFNYVELRTDLKKKGCIFTTDTDTEVILKIYSEYGEDGFDKLNGMWAFAILDIPNQRVVLSRDRFSIKPLYFYQFADQYYFSSEIKQLLPLLKNKQINLKCMYMYLKQGLFDFNDETFFNGIYKVKPKHNVIINLKNQNIIGKKYWEYTPKEVYCNDGNFIEQFREIFTDSVKIRLRSDVPVGCLLSGGLDSTSIAVTADKIISNGIDCFSVVSNNKKYSEEKFIDIVKNKNSVKVTKLFFKNEVAWDYLEKVIWHQEEPFGGFSVVAQNQIFKLIKENSEIRVVLSGQGGDEILCGYRKFFFFYLKEMIKQKKIPELLLNIILSLFCRTILWQFSLSDAKRYMRISQHNKIDPLKNILTFHEELEPIWSFKNLTERQILDIDKYSVPALVHYEDRNSMAYSIETRNPFLDHRLVNFAFSLPITMKIKNGWTKYVLRKALKELPQEIAWRRDKQGFLTPEEKWIKQNFRDKIMDLFNASQLNNMGLINKTKVLNLYKMFIKGNNLVSHSDISRFIIAEIWVKKFI